MMDILHSAIIENNLYGIESQNMASAWKALHVNDPFDTVGEKLPIVYIDKEGFEKMFREMRRKDRKLETIDTVEILKKCSYGILSTVGGNGYAYGVPLSFVYVKDSIYFHCALEGNKLDNIQKNNNVSFCVVGNTMLLPDTFSTNYESVVIFGKAVEVYDTEKNEALLAFIDKYSNQYVEKGKEYIKCAGNKTKVIKICIENITGKARR